MTRPESRDEFSGVVLVAKGERIIFHQACIEVRGHGGDPSSGINSEMAWFDDGSYTAVVLGNYDVPADTTMFDGLLEFLARQ